MWGSDVEPINNTMRLEFEKEENGKWYAVIPEWPYDHEELEMVDGADDLLDCLTQDGRLVTLDVETEEPSAEGYATFTLIDHDDYGGTYVTESPEVEVKQIWLCNVMHFVFDGEHPEVLYVRFE